MKIRVGHLYPDYLNIYADRGNIAVLARRASWRGHELEVEAISIGDVLRPGTHDLLYVGGGQDREQALVAVDLASRAEAVRESAAGGAAVLAVCGGYQLLGRSYRERDGAELPGIGLFPLHTVAGERRMIGDVLLDCDWAGRTLAGFENHAGRTRLDEGAVPLGRVVHGFGNDGESGFEGCRVGRAIGTVPARSAAAAQPVARGLAARAGARSRHRRRAAGARAAGRRAREQRRPRRVRARARGRGGRF